MLNEFKYLFSYQKKYLKLVKLYTTIILIQQGSEVSCHLQLHSDFKFYLGYLKPCLKETNTQAKSAKHNIKQTNKQHLNIFVDVLWITTID